MSSLNFALALCLILTQHLLTYAAAAQELTADDVSRVSLETNRPQQQAPKQITAVSNDDTEIVCDQDEIASEAAETRGLANDDNVSYRCRTGDKKLGEDNDSQRGNKELIGLRRDLLEQSGQGSEERVITLNRDNAELAGMQPSNMDQLSDIAETPDAGRGATQTRRLPFKGYVSFRANTTFTDDTVKLTDAGSRLGGIVVKKTQSGQELTGHIEIGANFFDDESGAISPDSNSIDNLDVRVLYLSYGWNGMSVEVGKNWSVYHDIAGLTDRLISLGGRAHGVYNAGTDGAAAGTGRATNSLQLRSGEGQWQWGLQGQLNTEIPDLEQSVDYKYGYAASLLWKNLAGFSVGGAFNNASVDDVTPEMQARGQTGDSSAAVLGLQWNNNLWTIAATASVTENLEADDEGQYFDSRGYELYLGYSLSDDYRFRLAYNGLQPNGNAYTGTFDLNDTYISLDYQFNSNRLADMIYLEYQWSNGQLADGSSSPDILVLGFRYNFVY
ncbi:porin [Halieaceae bacterium IMCC14734]|uniref:Porin n=1 Tax=Candidatus Litorirhabdus singularis TaxID=2518993 RepID=A0ABT3TD77_9GAMM|nr:hypothetical protein [Candidatus Litorirhabdus singularis]MCX2980257.1 porin [Candidatus Litorirhabdus singularis]